MEDDIDLVCHEDPSFIQELPTACPSLNLGAPHLSLDAPVPAQRVSHVSHLGQKQTTQQPLTPEIKRIAAIPMPPLELGGNHDDAALDTSTPSTTILATMKEYTCSISPRESNHNNNNNNNNNRKPVLTTQETKTNVAARSVPFVDAGEQNQPLFVGHIHRLADRYAFVIRRVRNRFDQMAFLVSWFYTAGELEKSAIGQNSPNYEAVRHCLVATFHLGLVPDAAVSQATLCSLPAPIGFFYSPLLDQSAPFTQGSIGTHMMEHSLQFVRHWEDLMLTGRWDTKSARAFFFEKMVPTARQMLFPDGREVESADLVRLFVSGYYGVTRGAHGSLAFIQHDNSVLCLRRGGDAQAVERLHGVCAEISAMQGFLSLPSLVRTTIVETWINVLKTSSSSSSSSSILRAPKPILVRRASILLSKKQ
jgi:hypothetical protein